MSSRINDNFMNEIAMALDETVQDRLGAGIGFIFIAIDDDNKGGVDFQYISNIQEQEVIQEMMTQVVTHDKTKN